ncbi:unnamed protein product [Parnassius mnemosyne]|uniref:Uncharacterized protein n=1 Tax=Parnassius mnemosyne TaxID=213953 RepID=A0AAV1L3G7_9NEOP
MKIVIFIALLFVARASTSKAALKQISDKVVTHIKTLTDKAASTIHKLAEDIDFKKLEKLDFLHLFTKKLGKKHHEQEVFMIDPYQVDRLKYYFEHTHGLKKPVGPHGSPHLEYGPPH